MNKFRNELYNNGLYYSVEHDDVNLTVGAKADLQTQRANTRFKR